MIQVLGSYPIGLSLCQFQTRESRQSVIGEDPEVLKGVIDICCGRLVLLVMVDSGCIEILSGVLVSFRVSDLVTPTTLWRDRGSRSRK